MVDNEWNEESRLAAQKEHHPDFALGATIAEEKGHQLTLQDFTKAVYDGLDYNRFDYEDGEFEMFKALFCVQDGYVRAGGTITFVEEIDGPYWIEDHPLLHGEAVAQQELSTIPAESEEKDIHSGECVECGRYSSRLSLNGLCEGCVMQGMIEARQRLESM